MIPPIRPDEEGAKFWGALSLGRAGVITRGQPFMSVAGHERRPSAINVGLSISAMPS